MRAYHQPCRRSVISLDDHRHACIRCLNAPNHETLESHRVANGRPSGCCPMANFGSVWNNMRKLSCLGQYCDQPVHGVKSRGATCFHSWLLLACLWQCKALTVGWPCVRPRIPRPVGGVHATSSSSRSMSAQRVIGSLLWLPKAKQPIRVIRMHLSYQTEFEILIPSIPVV